MTLNEGDIQRFTGKNKIVNSRRKQKVFKTYEHKIDEARIFK